MTFDIFREALRTPVESTVELYRQSLIGPKKLMAKIDGDKFRLMNIGLMWPINKFAATSRFGAMEGTVRESIDGSTIRARYKPLALVLVPLLGLALAGVVFTVVPLFLLANDLDGGAVFMTIGVCWDLMVVAAFTIAHFGGRSEARFIKECLDEIVGRMAAQRPATDTE